MTTFIILAKKKSEHRLFFKVDSIKYVHLWKQCSTFLSNLFILMLPVQQIFFINIIPGY